MCHIFYSKSSAFWAPLSFFSFSSSISRVFTIYTWLSYYFTWFSSETPQREKNILLLITFRCNCKERSNGDEDIISSTSDGDTCAFFAHCTFGMTGRAYLFERTSAYERMTQLKLKLKLKLAAYVTLSLLRYLLHTSLSYLLCLHFFILKTLSTIIATAREDYNLVCYAFYNKSAASIRTHAHCLTDCPRSLSLNSSSLNN